MNLTRDWFFTVGTELNLPQHQIEAFWNRLKGEEAEEASPFSKYLFYFGALIVISAMTVFMSVSWEIFGGGGIFLIATSYALIFLILGKNLWNKNGLRTAGGLLVTLTVCMTPLAIFGLETYFNVWKGDRPVHYEDFYNWVAGKWILMELGTILAGMMAIRLYPFPFLTAPIFFAAWYLTMDIVPVIFHRGLSVDQHSLITIAFGIVLILIGFVLDRKANKDFGFWAYLFGTISFWGGLGTFAWDKHESVLFIYLIINIFMMGCAVILKRNVLMVFGGIGAFIYFSHLASNIFGDSILFPFVLSSMGLVIIYLGILYQKNSIKIDNFLKEKFPLWLTHE